MKYPITEYDKNLLLQNSLSYKMKISVTDSNRRIVDVLYGFYGGGNININTDSNIRRTADFTLKLDDIVNNIESKIGNWLGLYYEIEIGILDQRTNQYIYYPCGRYCITTASTMYDASTNSISFNLSDRFSELDGTRNGQIGGIPIITIPKEIDGIKQTLRNSVINIISSSTRIDKYIVDDIGEFHGMPQNNSEYTTYRQRDDEWNIIPYDLEFSCGDTLSSMLLEIRDLNPNCQMYFDVYDNFCFDMIPSLDKDLPDMTNEYIQQILVANNTESVTYDVSGIKNVTEVFGKDYDIDYYTDTSSYSANTYVATIQNYTEYQKYDMIACKITSDSNSSPSLKINSLDTIPIYEEYTTTPLYAKELLKDETVVFRIYKDNGMYCAYYLGKYQPHALCVLTSDEMDSYYTRTYFSNIYNVEEKNIDFRVEPFSPFSVQRYGEVLDCKSGNDFDNILSDSIALQTARYYNRSTSTMFDTVTITTELIPWLDVNVKVYYKKLQEGTEYAYVVKSINHNFDSGTSEITMYRFMQLYE